MFTSASSWITPNVFIIGNNKTDNCYETWIDGCIQGFKSHFWTADTVLPLFAIVPEGFTVWAQVEMCKWNKIHRCAHWTACIHKYFDQHPVLNHLKWTYVSPLLIRAPLATCSYHLCCPPEDSLHLLPLPCSTIFLQPMLPL